MKFHAWLERKGEYVDSREVIKYLRGKGDKGVVVAMEVTSTLQQDGQEWMWIPTRVWLKNEYYNF
jgi:hypothetical protein